MKEEYEIRNNVEQWIVWKQEDTFAYYCLVGIDWLGGFILGFVIAKLISFL